MPTIPSSEALLALEREQGGDSGDRWAMPTVYLTVMTYCPVSFTKALR